MEFNQKLQELRKRKGLTQEELAEALYVSRTAISKWESGRGYPGIDSLKAIAKFFGVTIDALLSGDELLTIAEKDNMQKEKRFRDLSYGLLDLSMIMLLFLPFFAAKTDGKIQALSLISFDGIRLYMKIAYFTIVIGIIITGVLTLTLQKFQAAFWIKCKTKLSLALGALSVLLFVITLQPYAAIFAFVLLSIKMLMLIKKQ